MESSDGAVLVFSQDGTFEGKSLPAEYFTFYTSKSEVEGKKTNGEGKWGLKKRQGFKEVSLNCQKMDNMDVHGLYSVMISGENGALENQPPWYLFVWKEEEGGERYKFTKH